MDCQLAWAEAEQLGMGPYYQFERIFFFVTCRGCGHALIRIARLLLLGKRHAPSGVCILPRLSLALVAHASWNCSIVKLAAKYSLGVTDCQEIIHSNGISARTTLTLKQRLT